MVSPQTHPTPGALVPAHEVEASTQQRFHQPRARRRCEPPKQRLRSRRSPGQTFRRYSALPRVFRWHEPADRIERCLRSGRRKLVRRAWLQSPRSPKPPASAKSRIGIARTPATNPTHNCDCVSSNTTHELAVLRMKMPRSNAAWLMISARNCASASTLTAFGRNFIYLRANTRSSRTIATPQSSFEAVLYLANALISGIAFSTATDQPQSLIKSMST